MRLIDADSIRYWQEYQCYGHGDFEEDELVSKQEIDRLPTITPESLVRHGNWILKGRNILCSECKVVFEELEENELFEARAILGELCKIEKFCFNCGAKMYLEDA